MDPCVVDFYCPPATLIVEVDGEFHADRWEKDARRTACLESEGIG
jgi:very-short-patch-repair endonuclease